MKVIYEQIPGDGTIPKLTKGKEYIVVGLNYKSYRILDDDNEPILYPKECFIEKDSEIPGDWIRRDYPDDEYHIDPPECAYAGFYEDYFDGCDETRNVFIRVVKRLKNIENDA